MTGRTHRVPRSYGRRAFFWFGGDVKQSIGGVYRIGHEINHKDGPKIALWNTTITPEGIYKRTDYLPMRPHDRTATHFGCGDDSCRYDYDGNCVWTIRATDLSVTLRVHDFHAGIDCYPKSGALSKFAPHHMEVAGRVTGRVEAKGKSYEVDGLSFRDHSWGERAWDTVLSHRWLPGVFGADLSFCALSWHAVDDSLVKFGWIVRHNEVIYAKDVDIVSYVECDGATVRGGRFSMTLTTGEVFDVDFEAIAPSVMLDLHGMACVETICRVRSGDKVGIADFETTHNIQHGTRRPKRLSRGFAGKRLASGNATNMIRLDFSFWDHFGCRSPFQE